MHAHNQASTSCCRVEFANTDQVFLLEGNVRSVRARRRVNTELKHEKTVGAILSSLSPRLPR